VIPPGKSSEIILRLPIEAPRLPEDMVVNLRRLGVERIGDLGINHGRR
jgi:hypothetical protein